jgi:superfamily II DNA or RNA helicase
MKHWAYLAARQQMVRILECYEMFGQTTCQVWCPMEGTVMTVQEFDLSEAALPSLPEIRYRALAGRVVHALNQDVLLAPLEGQVQPMPHQFAVLDRVIYGDHARLLLADEVGLGKTIEAGLVMRELQLRGLIRRVLIVAPKGLLSQWASELWTHFGQRFWLVQGEEMRHADSPEELWQSHDRMIVSQDSVKPVAKHQGWDAARIKEYNRRRFEGLISASWDLVVIDEAHRLGGSTDGVARFRLGQGLAMASPYLLLLSATPHQGKSDQFGRLLSLLDSERFVDVAQMTPDQIRPYVVRTAKRQAVSVDGQPLFKPRHVELVVIDWQGPEFTAQRALYEAVTAYVRGRYQNAVKAKQYSTAFLLILMQRLVTSSPAAIARAIRRRLAILEGEDISAVTDWAATLSDEEDDAAVETGVAIRGEKGELHHLLTLAELAEQSKDARITRLLALMEEVRQHESSQTKFLIFTEFLPTQTMLQETLQSYGYRVSILNGQMSLEERQDVQTTFRNVAQVLVSTDAGGEGINLQFAHVVINYDLPWNPMKIEQRIGRVDRIGQTHDVQAFNFVMQDTVEYRVYKILLEKLQTILEEMGIDKLGDVLDSTGLDIDYTTLFMQSVVAPTQVDTALDQFVQNVRSQAAVNQGQEQPMNQPPPDLAKMAKILHHPFPEWLGAMVECYVVARGGAVTPGLFGRDIQFPDGEVVRGAVFRKSDMTAGGSYLGLHDPRIAHLVNQLPRMTPEEVIMRVTSPKFPAGLRGQFSLWQLTLSAGSRIRSRIVPLFVSEQGQVYRTTAQKVWEQMGGLDFEASLAMSQVLDEPAYRELSRLAEREAESSYHALMAEHRQFLTQERDKARTAFNIRKTLAERVGLREVRAFRIKALETELAQHLETLDAMERVTPTLFPILVVEVSAP